MNQMTDTQRDYREGMSRLGAAVNLITTDGAAGRHGVTASAVCSVTDSPPTLLVCINRNAYIHDRLVQNGVLCVNVLAAQHRALSGLFARWTDGVDRFGQGRWTVLATGAPVLEDANVAFDCRIGSRLEQGTHSVFFCEVLATRLSETMAEGLVWFSRDYHHLTAGRG